MRASTLIKRVLLGVGALVVLGIVGLLGFIWFGPVAISDKGMLLDTLIGTSFSAPVPDAAQDQLHLPPGFKLSVFASDLRGARFMRVTSQGDLLISLPRSGQVIWLERDRNGDGRADSRHVLIDNLNRP